MIVNEKTTKNEAVERNKKYSGWAFDFDRKESGKEKYGRNELKTRNHNKHGEVVGQFDFEVDDQRRKIAADDSHYEQSVSDCLKNLSVQCGSYLASATCLQKKTDLETVNLK